MAENASFYSSSSSSSLMIPNCIARPFTLLITSSCTKLKLMQIRAIPNNKYSEHNAIRTSPSVFFWSGVKSPNPIVVNVMKQK